MRMSCNPAPLPGGYLHLFPVEGRSVHAQIPGCRHATTISRTVVGMTAVDGPCAVQLLGDNHPHQCMGKGQW